MRRNCFLVVLSFLLLCAACSCSSDAEEPAQERILKAFAVTENPPMLQKVSYLGMDECHGMLANATTVFSFGNSVPGYQLAINEVSSSGEVWGLLQKGRAFGESAHVSGIQITKDSLYVSAEPNRLFVYSLDSLSHHKPYPEHAYEIEPLASNVIRTSEGDFLYIRRNLDDPRNSTLYKLVREDGSELHFGEFEPLDIELPADDESKQTAWQGKMTASPGMDKAVCLFSYAAGFDLIDVRSQRIIRCLWERPNVVVRAVPQLKINMIRPAEDFSNIFRDCCVSDEYVYLLARTTDGAEYWVLKYDWSGNAVSRMPLPSGWTYSKIAVDEADENLYLMVPDRDGNILMRACI